MDANILGEKKWRENEKKWGEKAKKLRKNFIKIRFYIVLYFHSDLN